MAVSQRVSMPAAVDAPSQASTTVTPTATTTPVPTPISSLIFITIRGVACIDHDQNGECGADEARVPNVILRNSESVAAVTDNAGEFVLQAAPRSELDITIPAGYRSTNGNLHRYRLQMADARTVDIPLAIDAAAAGRTDGVNSSVSDIQQDISVSSFTSLFNNASWLLLVAATVLATLLILALLRRLHLLNGRVFGSQYDAQSLQLGVDPGEKLDIAEDWQQLAGRVIADTLRQTVAIDKNAGILNAIAEPYPRFSVVTHDRRAIMFTTNPGFLRRAHLIHWDNRVIDVTTRSSVNHNLVRVLWQHLCATRNLHSVLPPDSTHWYIVVKTADNRPHRRNPFEYLRKLITPKPTPQPYQPWRGKA